MDVFTVYTTPKKHCAKWKKFSHQRPYNSLALYHDPFYIFAQFSPAPIGFGTGSLEPNFLLQRLFKKLLIHFSFLSNIHYSACYWPKCQKCTCLPIEEMRVQSNLPNIFSLGVMIGWPKMHQTIRNYLSS